MFWFLHQTTTRPLGTSKGLRCISFDSYIKPQPCLSSPRYWIVVYLLIPTSNHNWLVAGHHLAELYIFWFLHQTTTVIYLTYHYRCCISFDSYIKPQHTALTLFALLGCISFDSYIKPQPYAGRGRSLEVVYLLIPTSNHNRLSAIVHLLPVVYLLIPTSNHNCSGSAGIWYWVVYLLIPTSNHNCGLSPSAWCSLYIFWFLHQTTTLAKSGSRLTCCISFDSYIKPQRCMLQLLAESVVYLLIPTSNHNSSLACKFAYLLYIFWFLHQTTTDGTVVHFCKELYIFWFLHQTTTKHRQMGW